MALLYQQCFTLLYRHTSHYWKAVNVNETYHVNEVPSYWNKNLIKLIPCIWFFVGTFILM